MTSVVGCGAVCGCKFRGFGGREGARTPDLVVANEKSHTRSRPVSRKCFSLNGRQGLLRSSREFTGHRNQYRNRNTTGTTKRANPAMTKKDAEKDRLGAVEYE
jgi:hypothetical protein